MSLTAEWLRILALAPEDVRSRSGSRTQKGSRSSLSNRSACVVLVLFRACCSCCMPVPVGSLAPGWPPAGEPIANGFLWSLISPGSCRPTSSGAASGQFCCSRPGCGLRPTGMFLLQKNRLAPSPHRCSCRAGVVSIVLIMGGTSCYCCCTDYKADVVPLLKISFKTYG